MDDKKQKHTPGKDPKPDKGKDNLHRPEREVPVTPPRPHALSNG